MHVPEQSLVQVAIANVSFANTGMVFPTITAINGNNSLPEFLKNSRRDWMFFSSLSIWVVFVLFICALNLYVSNATRTLIGTTTPAGFLA